MPKETSPKEVAVAFLKMCALESPAAAFAKYLNADFKHHNQHFPGDRESLMKAMIESDSKMPNLSFTVQQVFADGDRIAVFSRVEKKEMEIAVVHMFRFSNGKISELWDVGQVLQKDSPNQNGMF